MKWEMHEMDAQRCGCMLQIIKLKGQTGLQSHTEEDKFNQTRDLILV